MAAGSHALVYAYRPHSFRLGLTISVATLSIVALLGCCSLARAGQTSRGAAWSDPSEGC